MLPGHVRCVNMVNYRSTLVVLMYFKIPGCSTVPRITFGMKFDKFVESGITFFTGVVLMI